MIEVDTKTAWRRTGKTQESYSDSVGMTVYNFRRLLYRNGLPSIPMAYNMAVVSGELRINGPYGAVVMRPEDNRTPPPAAPATVLPLRRDAA